MQKVSIHDKNFRLMIPHSEIVEIIKGVAQQLNTEYEHAPKTPLLLCTLTGALPFAAELLKHLKFDPEITTIKASSYEGTKTTGHVKITSAPTIPVDGQDILILEDIVDTGFTLEALRRELKEMGAANVRMVTMLFKPDNFHRQELLTGKMTAPEFVGKAIPNEFIVGFGLDYDEKGRALKDIYVLDE